MLIRKPDDDLPSPGEKWAEFLSKEVGEIVVLVYRREDMKRAWEAHKGKAIWCVDEIDQLIAIEQEPEGKEIINGMNQLRKTFGPTYESPGLFRAWTWREATCIGILKQAYTDAAAVCGDKVLEVIDLLMTHKEAAPRLRAIETEWQEAIKDGAMNKCKRLAARFVDAHKWALKQCEKAKA